MKFVVGFKTSYDNYLFSIFIFHLMLLLFLLPKLCTYLIHSTMTIYTFSSHFQILILRLNSERALNDKHTLSDFIKGKYRCTQVSIHTLYMSKITARQLNDRKNDPQPSKRWPEKSTENRTTQFA